MRGLPDRNRSECRRGQNVLDYRLEDTRHTLIHTQDTVAFPPEIKAYHQLLNDVALTFGAVGCSPARQTFTVTITGVAGGVVGTLIAHFRTHLAVVASRTNCKTLLEEVRLSLNIKNICVDLHVQLLIPTLITVGTCVTWRAVALSCHMVAAVGLATGWA